MIFFRMSLMKREQYNLYSNMTIKDISNNIDTFINMVNESNGKIVFVLDICFILNFMVKMKNQSKPNHLVDIILFKLSNLSKSTNSNISNVSEIFILDKQNLITNQNNFFYLQLEKCLKKNIPINDEKYIHVYKNVEESIKENVYWNILEPYIKI